MSRAVILFTSAWADVPLSELAGRAGEWGYQGLELCTWGDHLEVQRALSEPDYCPMKLDLLARQDLQLPVVAAHRVGQAVSDLIDERHQELVPEYVWGDGHPDGVRQRAAEELTATIRVAQKLGASVVSGFTGSPIWSYVLGYPSVKPEVIRRGLERLVHDWHPILDVCRDTGVRFALEVHPGQIAFDLHSAELTLAAFDGREELGFTLDPAHLHYLGVDPVEFIRRFPDRIYHVHLRDAVLCLNGRNSLLSGYWSSGDPRRGFQFRAPGRGGVDWEAFIRELNAIGYTGPLSVDWHDPGIDRDFGAEEACRFAKQLDFPPPISSRRSEATAFRSR